MRAWPRTKTSKIHHDCFPFRTLVRVLESTSSSARVIGTKKRGRSCAPQVRQSPGLAPSKGVRDDDFIVTPALPCSGKRAKEKSLGWVSLSIITVVTTSYLVFVWTSAVEVREGPGRRHGYRERFNSFVWTCYSMRCESVHAFGPTFLVHPRSNIWPDIQA